MSAAWTDDRLRALALDLSDRMDRLRAEGATVATDGLDRRDQLAAKLVQRLDVLRAQEAPRRAGNVVPAAHRFRPTPEPAEGWEAMVRRHNPGMTEAQVQARLRRDAELLREAARAIRSLPPLDGEPAA